jgi:hypothetical protein
MTRFRSFLRGWHLALGSRVELVDTAVRVSEENRRLHLENAAAKAALRTAVSRWQRVQRDNERLREFLSVVEIGDVK